jgi:hypothetical protein
MICQKLAAQDTLNFPPPAVAPTVYATEVQEPIIVDGKLAEPSWRKANAINDFFRIEPRQGGEYLYKTELRLLFDKKNLYVGVFLKKAWGIKVYAFKTLEGILLLMKTIIF